MSRRRRIAALLATLLGILAGAERPAAAQEAGPPSLVQFGGEVRWRVVGWYATEFCETIDTRACTGPQERALRLRTRLYGEATFAEHFTARLELQHSRNWSTRDVVVDQMDLVRVREALCTWTPQADGALALRAGRFVVPTFGDGWLMGEDPWDDLGRTLDGLAVDWAPGTLRVHGLLANASRSDPVPEYPGRGDDHWIAGAVLEWRGVDWLDLDGYLFGRRFNSHYVSEDPGRTGRRDRIDMTLGTRALLHARGVRLSGEVYGQLGRQGPDTVSAWASVERIEYQVLGLELAPSVFFEHAFASGDKRPTDGRNNTFDPLFPVAHAHLGPHDALGWRNVNALATGFSLPLGLFWGPLEGVTFTFVARGSFLASQHDAWYGADGEPILRDPTGHTASSRTLEGELSGWFDVQLKEGVAELSFGCAHWCPNNVLRDLNFRRHRYRLWIQTTVRF